MVSISLTRVLVAPPAMLSSVESKVIVSQLAFDRRKQAVCMVCGGLRLGGGLAVDVVEQQVNRFLYLMQPKAGNEMDEPWLQFAAVS
jgi:hypothetical protein